MTRSFLKSSWTTAGYDPSFMAGYAKSVVFPSSSTLPELAVAAFGGEHPEFAYKIYVLVSAAAVPWLIALACLLWRIPARGAAIAVLLDLLYVWTDFPINYVFWGMLPYFLAIPMALAATGAFGRFLTAARADQLVDFRRLDEPRVPDSLHLGDDHRAGRGAGVLCRGCAWLADKPPRPRAATRRVRASCHGWHRSANG